MKKIIAITMTLILLFSTAAFAATNATSISRSLTFTGTTANCKVSVSDSGKSISVTMKLYQGSTELASWTASDTSRVVLSKTYAATSGVTYRLEASGTINGVPFTATPVTKTCP